MNKTELWNVLEITFNAKTKVNGFCDAYVDVIFTHKEAGISLTMPAFWDGGYIWKVRFAPTIIGQWVYRVNEVKGTKLSIDGIIGSFEAVEYTGNYDIYKHGFIKTIPQTRYFVYDDGTPFFYLGDTHWAMLAEEIDEAGPHAVDIKTDSHFKYIVDKRVLQKFTVYQSEPNGKKYDIWDGIDETDIEDFKRVDRYFEYIAQKGLVHANALYIFPAEVREKFFEEDFLYDLARFWVARYAAYPVIWTLGQEVDRCYFGKNGITAENNPYKTLCKFVYQFDPYKHPITAHQENALKTGAKGGILAQHVPSENGFIDRINLQSAFYGMKEHTWWGAQWRPEIYMQHNFNVPKDYWYDGEGKVTINYETRYDYLYTKNYGARANGWISFLNGMFGYGYGAADIWAYLNRYSFNVASFDGVETVLPIEKEMPWGVSVNMATGDQMTILRQFFESFDWYKLVPDFDEGNAFKKTDKKGFYTAAYIGNEKYVVYLYNKTLDSAGKIVNMDEKATYKLQWFDTRTGEYITIDEEFNGTEFDLPEKPQKDDYIFIATKNIKHSQL